MTLMEHPVMVEKIDTSQPILLSGEKPDRPLPILCEESAQDRWGWLVVAGVVVALYAIMTLGFWAPADGGVDQNAYLLGGRMIAEHFSPRYTLGNPFEYVGSMFIRTSKLDVAGGDYYPKYPFGLPLIYASFFWIAGPTKAATLAFLVSPVSSILAVAGMFFLARLICGSFAGVMAAILLSTSQLMIELSNNPNSHAACVAFIIWGMYCLIKWWQQGGIWRGALAGFLIGYACLIRYSEGLLILPIAVACASRLRWSDWRSYLRCAVPGLAWAIPVVTLLIFNKHTMGNWTGYDSTNESEGFTWLKFTETWEQMIRTYYDMGAFFVLPFGLAGIAIVCGKSWRLGAMLLAWLLPGTALYTAYYWSPDRGISYARFILTFVPVVMLGTAICFSDGILLPVRNARWYRRIPRELAVGVVVLIASALGVYRAVHGLQQGQTGGGMMSLEEEFRQRRSLANIGQVLLNKVPVNSVIFADNSGGGGGGGGGNEKPLNYIQFLRHWDVYAIDAFDYGGGRHEPANFARGFLGGVGLGGNRDPLPDPNAPPTPRQQLQVDYLEQLYNKKTTSDLRKLKANVIDAALSAGRGVFALIPASKDRDVRRDFIFTGKYKLTVVDSWTDLLPGPPDPVAENSSNNGTNRKNRIRPNNGNGGNGRRGGGVGIFTTPEPTAVTWELLEVKKAG
jgi:hypothetical protein